MQRGRGRRDARRGAGVRPTASAVVAAGGQGARAKSAQPKQFLPLAGKPLFRWALEDVLDAGCNPVVLVVPREQVGGARALTSDLESVLVVEGGKTRRESVARGLTEVTTTQVVIHDAARPLAGADLVKDVLAGLDDAVAVVPLVPIDETVKSKTDETVSTVDRSNLFVSQTPQAFDTEALRAAHHQAQLQEMEVTDDAELIERFGGKIASVTGHRRNIKVTFPEDFELAESLLQP